MKSSLRVSVVQHACSSVYEDNLATAAKGIQEAAEQGAELVLLPELHTGLYFCQTENTIHFNLAENIPGKSTEFFSRLAMEYRIVIVMSVFEKRTLGIYHNTVVVIEKNGMLAGKYRKIHIPDDPGFYEKFYFTPGDLGFTPISTSVGKLGVLICWDQWFPEAARLMTLAGAEILLYPSAIGWGTQENNEAEKSRQQDAWITIQRSHAIANGLPIIVANRVGFEAATSTSSKGINFWGSSFITGPQGEFLAKANQTPELIMAEVHDLRSATVRHSWPFLRDRRIDMYSPLNRYFID